MTLGKEKLAILTETRRCPHRCTGLCYNLCNHPSMEMDGYVKICDEMDIPDFCPLPPASLIRPEASLEDTLQKLTRISQQISQDSELCINTTCVPARETPETDVFYAWISGVSLDIVKDGENITPAASGPTPELALTTMLHKILGNRIVFTPNKSRDTKYYDVDDDGNCREVTE